LYHYQIYDASAGSGKTFTLVKEYLKLILAREGRQDFRKILAITFTNKAVNEMKQRILKNLALFSTDPEAARKESLFQQISDELELSPDALSERAGKVLREILHNYAFFDISTIDKFNHRIIRTFARDLKLPQNFEVVLDKDLLLSEGIDRMLGNALPGNKITELLIDFALRKIDDSKSWDVSYDLTRIGAVLFDENHLEYLQGIKGRKLEDFLGLQETSRSLIKKLTATIEKIADRVLAMLEEAGLEETDFKSRWFPAFMNKIKQDPLKSDFNSGWKQNFGNEDLYSKTLPQGKKDIIDGLMPSFIDLWTQLRRVHPRLLFLKNVYQNLVPLTLLNALQREIGTLLEEREQIHISAFNSLISEQIRDQPAPFIYERLGEKYRHYFIDEFQDTSLMQWRNLVPLVSHALQSEDLQGNRGSLFLVGDAKQAIYRWRGGRSELFLNLIQQKDDLFGIPPHTDSLLTNYRSFEEVVDFNNRFFTFAVPYLNNELYRQLFIEGNKQKHTSSKGGLVSLQFLASDMEDKEQAYCEEVIKTIEELLASGVLYRDICVLFRANRHGVRIAEYLMEREVPVISSDALLLGSDPSVQFLINLLKFSRQTADLNTQYDILFYLSAPDHRNALISEHLGRLSTFLKAEYDFDLPTFSQRSVYDALEYAISRFGLIGDSHAFISALLDEVLEVEKQMDSGVTSFLELWEKNKGKWSIPAPEEVDAVQLMTIHKSKGLEFPFVIFPFANTPIYDDRGTQLWVATRDEALQGFDYILLSKKNEMETYNDESRIAFEEEQHKQELDAFNVLYVALTRGIQGVFVLSEMDLTKKGDPKSGHYSGLFIEFLIAEGLWDPQKLRYDFGELRDVKPHSSQGINREVLSFTYSAKFDGHLEISTRAGELWGTSRDLALSRGNLFHYGMSVIETGEDIGPTVSELVSRGMIPEDQQATYSDLFLRIVNHPLLSPFFEPGPSIMNEHSIIAENGVILRPDRMVFKGDMVSILDYKTGIQDPSHAQQLNTYAEVLSAMGYSVENKVLVYVEDQIKPVFI
jgi:ATP-dependent exoDNAse (exonuclease V) beta subunit